MKSHKYPRKGGRGKGQGEEKKSVKTEEIISGV